MNNIPTAGELADDELTKVTGGDGKTKTPPKPAPTTPSVGLSLDGVQGESLTDSKSNGSIE